MSAGVIPPDGVSGEAWEADVREAVLSELLECYGEGEDTDWPYLNDLCDVIVSMIEKHAAAAAPHLLAETRAENERLRGARAQMYVALANIRDRHQPDCEEFKHAVHVIGTKEEPLIPEEVALGHRQRLGKQRDALRAERDRLVAVVDAARQLDDAWEHDWWGSVLPEAVFSLRDALAALDRECPAQQEGPV